MKKRCLACGRERSISKFSVAALKINLMMCAACYKLHDKNIQMTKHLGLSPSVEKRTCLRCNHDFLSINKNRICNECKKSVEWKDGTFSHQILS